ncbi:MAG: hypothetical protein Q8891_13840 [Bacteroidota bacterium]|nr:hypothetical protein [Bacteroidota bacterium]
MRILFISTHNLATNPRLVKEIDLALENQYEVSVLCCTFENWSQKINEGIINRLRNKVNFYLVPGNRNPMGGWITSSFVFALAGMGLRIFPRNSLLLSLKSNKRSFLLLQYLKKIKGKIDLVIAHNPGSFYPAMQYARKNKIPFGIDLEDYHPGETTDKKISRYLKYLLKKIVPKADYLSAASPLILQYSLKDIGPYKKTTEVIMNWFPADEFRQPLEIHKERFQLVWFSQNIARGRGLEDMIPVIKKLSHIVELHLYGNQDPSFFDAYLKGIDNIIIHEPLPQPVLHHELAKYDAGLALENTASNLNRDLCITNKILSYYQAGLYIIASPTKAQTEFVRDHKESGTLVELSPGNMEETLDQLYLQKEKICSQKQSRYQASGTNNWELESQKILQTWKEILH